MGTWLSIATPVCLTVSIAGLVLSVIAWRRKGARSGLRGIAWSLLPLAAWLTHSVHMLGRIGSAIVQFASGFVFSPEAWLGVVLVGVSAALFLISGGIPLVKSRKRRKDKRDDQAAGRGQRPASVPATRDRQAVPAAQDDDLADVRDILKKHGIS